MALVLFRARENDLLGDLFRLTCEVGKGSFGEVWQAVRLADGETVALKIPKDQEKGEEVLKQEADIIKDIRHPNIVRIYGYHYVSHVFFIEMEYVNGYDLGEILDGVNSEHPLSFQQILSWTIQVLEGLSAVHSAKISHNDLKPQNILIENDTSAARITDFGTSRRLEDVWVWTKRQGTEAYMAPEVALDGKRGRNVSDIYSMGVLLYEMTTGRLPYTSPHQLLTGSHIAKPREINSDVPANLETVIMRAMARNPEERYQDVAEMLADTEACLVDLERREASEKMVVRVAPSQLGFRPPSSSPLYYLELAKKRLAEQDDQGAMEAAEAAVNRSDEHPQYIRMLGGVCLRIGYFSKAIQAYEKLQGIYERGYPAEIQEKREVLERLGKLYLDQKNYGKAIRIFERLLQIHDSPYSRFQLAVSAGLNGDYRRAIDLLEEVRAERPDTVVIYSKLAWAYALDGNDRMALSFYNQALALDPYDVFSLFHLGKYYHIMGDRRRSSEYFKRALEADRQGIFADQIRDLESG
jgi:serine/threonine protein kinase